MNIAAIKQRFKRGNMPNENLIAVFLGEEHTASIHFRKAGEAYKVMGYRIAGPLPIDLKTGAAPFKAFFAEQAQYFEVPKAQLVVALNDKLTAHRYFELRVNQLDLFKRARKQLGLALNHDLGNNSVATQLFANSGLEFDVNEGTYKHRVLAAAAGNTLLKNIFHGAKEAGFQVAQITSGTAALYNSLHLSLSHILTNEVVLSLNFGNEKIGFSIFDRGDLVSYEEYNFKTKWLEGVTGEAVAFALNNPDNNPETGRIARACQLVKVIETVVNNFEGLDGRRIRCIFVNGERVPEGVLDQVKETAGVPCRMWDPLRGILLELSDLQQRSIKLDAQKLAPALGAGLGLFMPGAVRLDFLQDPARKESFKTATFDYGLAGTVVLGICLLAVAGATVMRQGQVDRDLKQKVHEVMALERKQQELKNVIVEGAGMHARHEALTRFASARYYLHPLLIGLQGAQPSGFQISQLSIENSLTDAASPVRRSAEKMPEDIQRGIDEKLVVTILGKNKGRNLAAVNTYVQGLKTHPHLQTYILPSTPVRIKSTGFAEEGTNVVATFSLECIVSPGGRK